MSKRTDNPTSTRIAKSELSQHTTSESHSIVDFEGAMTRLAGDRGLFREFIAVYDEDMPTLLKTLHAALDARDVEGLERNAHSLRGLISNFGARQAVEAAAQIEDIAKKNRWQETTAAVNSLDHEISRLTEALDEYRV